MRAILKHDAKHCGKARPGELRQQSRPPSAEESYREIRFVSLIERESRRIRLLLCHRFLQHEHNRATNSQRYQGLVMMRGRKGRQRGRAGRREKRETGKRGKRRRRDIVCRRISWLVTCSSLRAYVRACASRQNIDKLVLFVRICRRFGASLPDHMRAAMTRGTSAGAPMT